MPLLQMQVRLVLRRLSSTKLWNKVDESVIALDLFMKEPTEAVKNFAISKIELLGAARK